MKDDEKLEEKSSMSAESLRDLFSTCVETTYFVFNGTLYIQVNGLAIGKSTSGFAAEIFMQKLEQKALNTFREPPEWWKRYVDDTITKLLLRNVESFLLHLNSQHERIKFTTEIQKDNKIAFLDTEIHVKDDGSTKIKIYRKATHTDQYLHFNSNHHIKQKIGIIQTFRNRIDTLVTEEEDKKLEEEHVIKALKRCGHPEWSLRKRTRRNKEKVEKEKSYGKVIIPYINKLSEKMARIFKKYSIEAIHKPTKTIHNMVCIKKKDKVHDLDKVGVV